MNHKSDERSAGIMGNVNFLNFESIYRKYVVVWIGSLGWAGAAKCIGPIIRTALNRPRRQPLYPSNHQRRQTAR